MLTLFTTPIKPKKDSSKEVKDVKDVIKDVKNTPKIIKEIKDTTTPSLKGETKMVSKGLFSKGIFNKESPLRISISSRYKSFKYSITYLLSKIASLLFLDSLYHAYIKYISLYYRVRITM